MVKKGLVLLEGQDMYLKHEHAGACPTKQCRMLKFPNVFNPSFLCKPCLKPFLLRGVMQDAENILAMSSTFCRFLLNVTSCRHEEPTELWSDSQ